MEYVTAVLCVIIIGLLMQIRRLCQLMQRPRKKKKLRGSDATGYAKGGQLPPTPSPERISPSEPPATSLFDQHYDS